jgi:hypothetical protein
MRSRDAKTYCLQPEVPLRPLLPLLPRPPSGQLLLHHHLRHRLRRLVLSSTCQLIQPITKHIDGNNVSSAKHDCQRHYQPGRKLTFATADANTDAHAAERLFPLADATAASDSAETSVPADPTTMAESAATSSCFCASDRPSRLDTTMFYIFWCRAEVTREIIVRSS